VIVELKEQPGVLRKVAAEKDGQAVTLEQSIAYAQELVGKQNTVLASLPQFGVRALLRETNVKQVNGESRHIQYRFTYLLNGFVAYVATADIDRLRRTRKSAMSASHSKQPSTSIRRSITASAPRRTRQIAATQFTVRRKSFARSTPARTLKLRGRRSMASKVRA
jgi:hypothetical protein